MRRKREICEKCSYFFNGSGEHDGKRYAFCMNTELHGDSSFYESVARIRPDSCPESDFFGKEYDEEILSECPFKTEQLMKEWNNEEKA